MKKKDIETLKKILEEERRKITRHLEELSDTSEEDPLPGATGDSVDIASMEINQTSLLKLGKREIQLLKKIDHALSKIEGGTYGECESCGEEIGVARLMARPVAQLCIDCKTDQENVERRYSSREGEGEDDGFPEETEEL